MVKEVKQDTLDETEALPPEDSKRSDHPIMCGTPFMGKFKGKAEKPFTGIRREFFPPLNRKDEE